MSKALKACPNGIDGYFENVGGWIMDAVMLRMNAFSRIALCGMIAGYDGAPAAHGQPALMLINRMKVEGFIVSEHMEVWPDALKELGMLVGTGKLRPRETIARALLQRPRPSWACSKARTLASNWSSWYEAEPLRVSPRGRRPWAGRSARRPWPDSAPVTLLNIPLRGMSYDAAGSGPALTTWACTPCTTLACAARSSSWSRARTRTRTALISSPITCWATTRAGVLQACLRVVDPGVNYPEPSIGRVVTAKEARGNGTGRLLVAEGLARCQQGVAGRAVRISAQAHLQRFYGSFGFVAVSDEYLEDDIPTSKCCGPTRGAGLNGRAARVPQLVTPQCARASAFG